MHKAVVDTFSKKAVIQRFQVHKKQNILSYLPRTEQANIGLDLSKAYLEFEYDKAKKRLDLLAKGLDIQYPSAAASLREGLEETLTVHRLKIPAILRKTLASINAMESTNSTASARVCRVSNWQNGEMILRHFAAGFLEAEASFRQVSGFREIPFLTAALAAETVLEDYSPLIYS